MPTLTLTLLLDSIDRVDSWPKAIVLVAGILALAWIAVEIVRRIR